MSIESSPRIWIDADAAPREVKELVYRASTRLKLAVILVANQTIGTPHGNPLVRCITVTDGANVADKYIVKHAAVGDVAITADVPLAAELTNNGVFVIDPRGQVYDDSNVSSRLASRDLMDAARGSGIELSGPAPYSVKDKNKFASALDRILTKATRNAGKRT